MSTLPNPSPANQNLPNPPAPANSGVIVSSTPDGEQPSSPDPQPNPPGPPPPVNDSSDNRIRDEDAIPSVVGLGEQENSGAGKEADNAGSPLINRRGFWGWLERKTGIQQPYLWLIFNSLVSFFWGTALATFASGVVPWAWNLSEFSKKFDSDWTNETVALVGSLCTLHVTYVLQLILKEYSYVMLAGEFTLKDLKCLQGVNEISVFAEFPDRPGAPRRVTGARGPKAWWGSVYRFCHNKRFVWYVLYLGVALHTTSIVSILQPGECMAKIVSCAALDFVH
jgi:hypothetical protein